MWKTKNRRCGPCLLVAAISIILFCSTCAPKAEPVDTIITGTIYTANHQQPIVDAVAIKGDRIVYVGSNLEASRYQGENTRVIALGENIMTPGFIDGHAHLLELGYNEMQLDLSNAKNYDEIVLMVKDAVSKTAPGQWILGRGWHQDKWNVKPDTMIGGFQTHHALSEMSPDNPVYLSHASGHAALANAKAMEIAGVNLLAPDKRQDKLPGGEIITDELGNPTGIFTENAMTLIESYIPAKTDSTNEHALQLAMQVCLRNGITAVHDAGAAKPSLDLLYRFKEENKLKIRLYVMLSHDRVLLNNWFKKGPDIDTTHWLTVRAVKLYTDGALGSRGAWLLEPYADRPDYSGAATISMDTVFQIAKEGLQYGFQICSHAIGDRANREVLDNYEKAFATRQEKIDHRFRIEHAQHLHPADLPRFAALGVIPSMQAIHMSSDRPWAIERLGQQRIESGAYMWSDLFRSGARVVNGTDAPVEPINPVQCFYASVTRKTLQGLPEDGFEPGQKMTREQALASYTINPAYAAFQEKVKGSIEVGKLADFTVFTKDIMRIPEDSILTTNVSMTIIGGKILYEKK